MFVSPRLSAFILSLALVCVPLALAYDPDSGTMGTTDSAAVQNPKIVHMHLAGTMNEIPIDDPFGFSGAGGPSLLNVIDTLNSASEDKDVRAIALTFDGLDIGSGQSDELRAALEKVKAAGKPVWVHLGSAETKDYALLSVASRIAMAPHAELWLTGLYGEQPYVKGLLDKLGVQAEVVHVGEYKAAGEIFTRTGPSPEADQNMNWLLDGMFKSLVDDIAAARGLEPAAVTALIDKAPFTAQQALDARLIDAVEQRDAFTSELKETFGPGAQIENDYEQAPAPEFNIKSPLALFSMLSDLAKPHAHDDADLSGQHVALIYIDGEIADGYGSSDLFGRQQGAYAGNLAQALSKAANDPLTRAVVLRIDSPGGSAEASESILQAALEVREAGKPLVVSMGNTAASGGYYVACAGDAIFADAKTLTGSIGVIGGKMVTTGLWDQLGVNWTGYGRGKHAGIFSTATAFTPEERERIQALMTETYALFRSHVEEARKDKLTKPVEELAGGRVYTGDQAKDLGLVDTIGGLDAALNDAGERAGLDEDFDVKIIPEPKDFITSLMEEISQEGEDPTDLIVAPHPQHGTHGQTGLDGGNTLTQAALPYLQGLDPRRTRATLRALRALELFSKPGTALIMPGEIMIR